MSNEETILTVGHGNRECAETIELLHKFGCEFLVDVRSSPFSRRLPQYNRETLESACKASGLYYLFMGPSRWASAIGGLLR